MKRLMFAVVFVAIALVALASAASADGPKPGKPGSAPKQSALEQFKVTSVKDVVVETPGFSSEGFKGDVTAAKRQAAGLDLQTADPASGAVTNAVTASTKYCKTRDAYRSGTGALSFLIGNYWEFHHKVYYCYDGTYLQGYPVSWSYANVNAPGWSYKGQIGVTRYWDPWPRTYYVWRQGEFALCASWCVQHNYPWVSWRLYGSGSATRRSGG